ncbi:Bbp16 family capsid cement protein [Methylotuvimicrobium sp. KM1]|uniref:Bbp16 family capsid cement protein n=1 Tax=Methylotuvimicrobium sp. KM1 TaxID=3377707 RepID=UPI00384FDC5B
MISDRLATFSQEQAVTDSAFGVDKIDLANVVDVQDSRDIGDGVPLNVAFGVDESAAASGSATVTFQVVSSDSPTLSDHVVLAQSGAIPKADLVAGRSPIGVSIPQSHSLSEPFGKRYIGVRYVIASGPLTAGKFSAVLIAGSIPSSGRLYGGGFTAV